MDWDQPGGPDDRRACSFCQDITFDTIEAAGPQGFPHRDSLQALEDRARTCPICSLIWDAIENEQKRYPTESRKAPFGMRLSGRDGPPSANIRLSVQTWNDAPEGITIRWYGYIRDENNEYQEVPRTAELLVEKIIKPPARPPPILHPSDMLSWIAKNSSNDNERRPFSQLSDSHTSYKKIQNVGDLDASKEPHLVITGSSEFTQGSKYPQYAALSYCWGKTGNFTTTSATLEERTQRISMDGMSAEGQSLPQTIKDAITICRGLDIRYLWVDALCIVQGSNEDATADWQTQSGLMGEIYGNASITIAAAKASDVHEGIFHESRLIQPDFTPSGVSIPHGGSALGEQLHLSARFTHAPLTRGSIFNEPLYKRAWALQERILSRRVVTYGTDEITWQCRACVETESDSPAPETTRSLSSFELKTLGFIWPRIVSQYSHFAATRATDKRPALSGLVKTIQSGGDFTYIAGLWKSTICNDLLWRAESFASLTQPAKYRAPSWSWASLDGAVNNTPRDGMDHAQLVESSITPAGLNPAGEVLDGWIIIRGPFGHLPRLDKGGLVSNMTEKFEILDDMGRLVGGAFLDTLDSIEPYSNPLGVYRQPNAKYGLQTKQNAGVILIHGRENSEDVYKRVGMFMLNAVGQTWFGGTKKKTIKII